MLLLVRRLWVGMLVVVLSTSALVVLGQERASAAADWEDAGFPAGPRGPTAKDDISVASAQSVWALAGFSPWRWDGAGWEQQQVTAGRYGAGVEYVSALADGGAWAVGAGGSDSSPLWLGRWSGSGWVTHDPPSLPGERFRLDSLALEATGPDDLWLAYADRESYDAPRGFGVLHFDGRSWTFPLRGPGCGYYDAKFSAVEEFAGLAIHRGRPVVGGVCRLPAQRDFAFVWELVEGRWAVRGARCPRIPRQRAPRAHRLPARPACPSARGVGQPDTRSCSSPG